MTCRRDSARGATRGRDFLGLLSGCRSRTQSTKVSPGRKRSLAQSREKVVILGIKFQSSTLRPARESFSAVYTFSRPVSLKVTTLPQERAHHVSLQCGAHFSSARSASCSGRRRHKTLNLPRFYDLETRNRARG